MSVNNPQGNARVGEPPPIMGRGGPPMAHMMGKPQSAKDVRGTLLRVWGYLRRQSGWLRMTTGAAPTASSAASNQRPSIGATPKARRTSAVPVTPTTDCAFSCPTL